MTNAIRSSFVIRHSSFRHSTFTMASAPATAAQLTAVLEEIAALVRSRVSLDQGLVHLGRDLGGRPGELMQALAKDMERGDSLTAAMAARGATFPPVFHAVVEA